MLFACLVLLTAEYLLVPHAGICCVLDMCSLVSTVFVWPCLVCKYYEPVFWYFWALNYTMTSCLQRRNELITPYLRLNDE